MMFIDDTKLIKIMASRMVPSDNAAKSEAEIKRDLAMDIATYMLSHDMVELIQEKTGNDLWPFERFTRYTAHAYVYSPFT